jgi:hypothetical protein
MARFGSDGHTARMSTKTEGAKPQTNTIRNGFPSTNPHIQMSPRMHADSPLRTSARGSSYVADLAALPPRHEHRAVSVFTDPIGPGRTAYWGYRGDHPGQVVVVHLAGVDAVRSPARGVPRDEVRPPGNHDPVVVHERSRGGGARRAGLWRWPGRPPLGGVRQRESDGGQVLVGGVPVDAVAPFIGLDGDGGAGGDPGPGGLTAGLPAHPVPTRLHAGRVRAAWRSRSRLRRQAPATRRPVRQPQRQIGHRPGSLWRPQSRQCCFARKRLVHNATSRPPRNALTDPEGCDVGERHQR